jgi:hypothetical protein
MIERLSLLCFLCLIALGGRQTVSQSIPKSFVGTGMIVAVQKYDRHRERPAENGLGTPAEEWIVRIDKWNGGSEVPGFFLVSYRALTTRALSDEEMNDLKWQFTVREPVDYESRYCAGDAPVWSNSGSLLGTRPALLKDFIRTRKGETMMLPPFGGLRCMVELVPPVPLTQ